MLHRVISFLGMILLSLSLTGFVFADEVKGKITKVGDEGREITVSSKGGKETTVKISGSRTSLDGVKKRSELKAGQNVTVEYEGDEAKKVKVIK